MLEAATSGALANLALIHSMVGPRSPPKSQKQSPNDQKFFARPACFLPTPVSATASAVSRAMSTDKTR